MDPTPHPAPLLSRLSHHPSCPEDAVAELRAGVRRTLGSFDLRFLLRGRLDRLCIPRFHGPERTHELWRHTCFEAFLHRPGEPGYLELNVSPSGQWAAYRFDGYRQGMRDLVLERPPTIRIRRAEDLLEVVLILEPPPSAARGAVRLALATVVESAVGELSYWSLAHPSDRPDFHHAASATLEIRDGGTGP